MAFPVHLSVSEVRYGERRIFTGFVHDLTDRRKAEDLATRLGRIIDNSVNEVYVYNAHTLRFTMVNRGARENLGYTMGIFWAIGRSMTKRCVPSNRVVGQATCGSSSMRLNGRRS